MEYNYTLPPPTVWTDQNKALPVPANQDASWSPYEPTNAGPYQGQMGGNTLPPVMMAQRQHTYPAYPAATQTSYTPYTEKHDPHARPVSQQPIPQQSMNVYRPSAGGNLNARNLPSGQNGRRAWSNGLCDCCADWKACVIAMYWPSCAYGTIKRRYDVLQQSGVPDPEHGNPGHCGGDCCLHYMLGCIFLQWVAQMQLRSKIRQRYNIDGDCCADCCTSFWCNPCDMTQQSRELTLEEDSFRMRVYQPQLSVTPG